ncbi:hypothetical protein B0I37DRAFT_434772 [Chaetomium sp. MPI-CAGE-AT-0009]|nr:hypothetical protein B0I37DRAFT_434772 [Chaetomium sp. MPI-CAGE-AT-0009]
MSKQSHIERTANEPREAALHTLTITRIDQISPTIRVIRLAIPPDDNITATYLSQPIPHLLHTPVQVRIGGRFVFPPPSLPLPPTTQETTATTPLRRVVLVAGGMGINPLVSMLSWIAEAGEGAQEGVGMRAGVEEVRVLYSVKDPGDGCGGRSILFLERMAGLFASGRVRGGVRLFLTGGGGGVGSVAAAASSVSAGGGGGDGPRGLVVGGGEFGVPCLRRRMTVGDVEEAIGGEKEAAVVYVCGVPGMTDEFVEALVAPDGFGMDPRRVLFERWW